MKHHRGCSRSQCFFFSTNVTPPAPEDIWSRARILPDCALYTLLHWFGSTRTVCRRDLLVKYKWPGCKWKRSVGGVGPRWAWEERAPVFSFISCVIFVLERESAVFWSLALFVLHFSLPPILSLCIIQRFTWFYYMIILNVIAWRLHKEKSGSS